MRVLLSFLSLLLLAAPAARAADDAGTFFETRVRPVLAVRCYSCHSTTAKKVKGGLLLDSREALLKGGDSGPAVVPGSPDKSRLMTAVGYQDSDLQMPPKAKLTDAQVADLSAWVKQGAPWPNSPATSASAPAKGGFDLQQRKASHWAWREIAPQQPPAVKDSAWARTPVDRFILARLEAKNLHPAAPADRRALIRRASFDLIGLPPTPAEVQAFVDDARPDAFERVVDRLLASPHFGERWARHWMDVVRYGETRGHEYDYPIPNAWHYRDYLIRAFNADVPYDQFVTEHLAGDLLDKPRLNPERGFNESILGTAFWFLGEELHSPVDIRQDEADRMNSRLDTMTKAFLGLTVGCARCHDHKFDAISAKDHYAMTGFLLGTAYRQVAFESLEHNRAVARQLWATRDAARPAILKATAAALRPGVERSGDYLLAAREALGSSSTGRVEEVARARSLDAALLAEWVKAMPAWANDPASPFYEVARAATGASRVNSAAAGGVPAQVIVDFAQPGAGWWADGFAFGVGPARAGDVDWGGGATPTLGLIARAAARRDSAWPTERPVGSEKDMGTLGEFARPGRTFRTPKVTLRNGRVWYLMRGSADVYAAVDSHLMVAGPLHGQLLSRVRSVKGGPWRWVGQDLTAYRGQRVEFEFTAVGGEPLEVAKVVESENPPPLIAPARFEAGESPAATAAALRGKLSAALTRLESDTIVGAPDAADVAPLADALLRNAGLFTAPDAPAWQAYSAALAQAAARQGELIAQVQVESHVAPAALDGNGVDESVLVRGVAKSAGECAPRRFLEAVAGSSQGAFPPNTSGRLELARAMLADGDPFPARVMVNRVWAHLFGTGIVPTVDNFGVLGQAPGHPELLDYLASEFRTRQGWSVKKLIRSIVLSNAYQMSSRPDSAAAQTDPQDALLHHMPLRRLEAEAIRDEILAVSGRLDARVGGPPVDVYLTPFMDGRGRSAGGPLDGNGRRSVYVKVRRNFLSPMMLAFDAPIPFATVGRRGVSNVPAQALILMNDPFVVQQAAAWAKRVVAAGGDVPARVRTMYAEAFARPPTAQELADAEAFLRDAGEGAWANFAHVLFNTKEFIFVR